jgi:N4-gp56 family major capsid protein
MSSTTTSLNDLLPQMVAEAVFQASERSIMRNLVKVYNIAPQTGKSVVVPSYPQATAYSLSEGGDITANVISTGGATLTVSEVGMMTTVTDLARISSASDVVSDVGRLFGEGIARKIDTDLTALFTGFTTSVVGNVTSTATAITAADIFNAVQKLKSLGVPSDDMACVVHPAIAYDLKANLTNTYANPNAGMAQNEVLATGYVGMLAGVPVYETSNLANNGSAGQYPGAVFHRSALGLALMRDIQIETQRDASLRADEIVATALYATGTVYEGHGCALGFKSSVVS